MQLPERQALADLPPVFSQARLMEHVECFKGAFDLGGGDIPLPADSCAAQFADGRYERMTDLHDLYKLESNLRKFSNWGENLSTLRDQRNLLDMRRTHLYLDLHLFEEAVEALSRSLPAHAPASEFVLFRRTYQAVAYARLGRHTQAIDILRDVVRINREFPWAQYYLGRSLEEMGRYLSAITAYEMADEFGYDLKDIAFRLANCYAEADRHEEAMSHYLLAIVDEAENPEVFNNLGLLLYKRGIGREAIENFQKAIDINPRYTDAWYNLGRGYEAVGKQAEAIEAYEKTLTLDRDYPEAWNNIGPLLRGMGRSNEAVGYFEQALSIDSKFSDAHFNLGVSLKAEGRYAEAAEHFEFITRLGTEDAATWRELGICCEKRGLLDEAVVVLERSTSLDNNDFNTWYFLARTYRALGRKDDAARAFKRMKVLNPALADALD